MVYCRQLVWNYLIIFLCWQQSFILCQQTKFESQPISVCLCADDWGDIFSNQRVPWRDIKDKLEMSGYILQQLSLEQILRPATHGLFDFIIFFDQSWDIWTDRVIEQVKTIPYQKRILFLWEPPTTMLKSYFRVYHNLFSRIFLPFYQLVDLKKYFKFYYPQMTIKRINTIDDFSQKKLCTSILARKKNDQKFNLGDVLVPLNCTTIKCEYLFESYSEREQAFNFFDQHPEDFDLYGIGWEQCRYKTYRGPVPSKIDVLKKYKFVIAYENTYGLHGYITEKIFDAFIAGTVPIVWGSEHLADIPAGCCIDAKQFGSYKNLYEFLKNMDRTEYNEYLHRIENFLRSERAYLFSADGFVELFEESFRKNIY